MTDETFNKAEFVEVEPKPFFLVGCGRSGTSLLRNLLNAHSRIAIPTESLFMIDYLRVQDRFELGYLIDLLVDEPEIAEWGIQVKAEDFKHCVDIPDVLRELHILYASTKGADVWGQKTPRLIRYLDILGTSFPEACFIHLIRDPRAVVSSLIQSDVHRSNPIHGSERWRLDVGSGLVYCRFHPERVFELKYEDLVQNPESRLEDILSFIGLTFEEGMVNNQGRGLGEYSDFYSNIHRNLNTQVSTIHINKWEEKLDPYAIAVIEKIVGHLMEKLNYSPSSTVVKVPQWHKVRMHLQRGTDIFRQISKYLAQRPKYFRYLIMRKMKFGLFKEFLRTIHY